MSLRSNAPLNSLTLAVALVVMGIGVSGVGYAHDPSANPGTPPGGQVVYLAHRARDGNDQGWIKDGAIGGFPYDDKSLENLRIVGVGRYKIHQQFDGWQNDWTSGDVKNGDTEESGASHGAGHQMEAIMFESPPRGLYIRLYQDAGHGFAWQQSLLVEPDAVYGIVGQNRPIKAIQLCIAPSQGAAERTFGLYEKAESVLRDYIETKKSLEPATVESINNAVKGLGHDPGEFTIHGGWQVWALRRVTRDGGPGAQVTLRGQISVDPHLGNNKVVFDIDVLVWIPNGGTSVKWDVSGPRNVEADSSGPLPWPIFKQEFPGRLKGVVEDKVGPALTKYLGENGPTFISW